jgi:hypothetical protein
MAKAKRGLHKEITSIFDGVPLPNNPVPQSPSSPAGGRDVSQRPAQPDKGRLEMPVVTGPPAPVDKPKVSEIAKPKTPAGPTPKAVPIEKPQGSFVVKSSARSFFENIVNQITARVLAPKPGVDSGRQKVMVLLVPVLFLVFIVVFVKVLPGLKGGAVAPMPPAPTGVASASSAQISWETPEPYPRTLRDPMQFGSTSTSGGPDDQGGTEVQLIVTGIVYSEDSPTAVIGTKIVREGDDIMGAKVVKINPDSVDFEKDGKRFTQRVQKK